MNIPKIRHSVGFTLIELTVVVAIIALTLSIGLPSFQTTIATNRLKNSANEMITALENARSESIKTVRIAGVVYKNGNSWDSVVEGTPNRILQQHNAAENTMLTITSSIVLAGDLIVRFRPDGRVLSSTPVVMEFSVDNSPEKRIITVQPSGTISQVVL